MRCKEMKMNKNKTNHTEKENLTALSRVSQIEFFSLEKQTVSAATFNKHYENIFLIRETAISDAKET